MSANVTMYLMHRTKLVQRALWRSVALTKLTAKVVGTATLRVEKVVYATLSHCWGGLSVYRLITNNRDMLSEQIPIHRLSATFKESFELCIMLGIRYIWIDSLCIVQDDDEDWHFEAARMHHVYAGSFLNLAASASFNGSQGLFTHHNPAFHERLCFRASNDLDFTEGKDSVSRTLRLCLSDSPLLKRGWVVQECFLAVRNLHWTDCGLIWQCNHSFTSEIGVDIRTNSIKQPFVHPTPASSASTTRELDKIWFEVASSFQGTRVTKGQDRYYAMAGLAAQFSECYRQLGVETRFYAGCWEHSLLHWITWKGQKPALSPPQVCTSTYVPTWSWMDRSQPHKGNGLELSSEYMKIARPDIIYGDPKNTLGPLKSGSITVTAPIFHLAYKEYTTSPTGYCIFGTFEGKAHPDRQGEIVSPDETNKVFVTLDPKESMETLSKRIKCAAVGMSTNDGKQATIHAMMLSPDLGSKHTDPLHHKIGMLQLERDGGIFSFNNVHIIERFIAGRIASETIRLE